MASILSKRSIQNIAFYKLRFVLNYHCLWSVTFFFLRTTLKTTLKWWNYYFNHYCLYFCWEFIQFVFQLGNTEFIEKEADAVNSILHDCIETEPKACNKETGAKQRLQKWSRGHLFIVRGGGIIDKWSPLFKWVWYKCKMETTSQKCTSLGVGAGIAFPQVSAKSCLFGQNYSGVNILKGCQGQACRLLSLTFTLSKRSSKEQMIFCFGKEPYILTTWISLKCVLWKPGRCILFPSTEQWQIFNGLSVFLLSFWFY